MLNTRSLCFARPESHPVVSVIGRDIEAVLLVKFQSLRFAPVFFVMPALMWCHAASAQDRAWELMDDLDVPVVVPEPRAALTSPAAGSDRTPSLAVPLTEKRAPARQAEILHSGMEPAQVRSIVGEPDSIAHSSAAGADTWSYGRSLLFFQENHLTGWSDAGNLTAQALAHGLTPTVREKSPQFNEQGWKNAWQRESKPDVGEVIDEIIQSPE